MYYGDKSVSELDTFYGIDSDEMEYSKWQYKECEKIQQSFMNHAIMLTLAECKILYKTWSSEYYSASWENGIDDSSEEDIFELLLPWLKDMIGDRINRIDILIDQLKINKYLDE